ncbi:putative transcriptional regulator, ModE family [Chthoniobacter flavus Ellin428]|uniref:Putative transcriptional regulator, ModE family n=1 Tax=Chthoniobacter flavus Ellin428 TaxID=497964 RepID=B4CUE5_9BACT|nr:LysR family transcriptional regulator [Chthoniobacter flavus]EDY22183.1 putative transcriptional regulator, ModE family [Chthoniobacter flavus Ellin428]TCO94788.1 molybdate transport system regulatory protein [Chthoniobacter flavus]
MTEPTLKVRVRIMNDEQIAFGPGKAQLLESLLATGSLNRTASLMKMSYVKALSLARTMNEQFAQPLVELARGGKQGGGTHVTELGRKVLAEYQAMADATEKAARPSWLRLRKLLRA